MSFDSPGDAPEAKMEVDAQTQTVLYVAVLDALRDAHLDQLLQNYQPSIRDAVFFPDDVYGGECDRYGISLQFPSYRTDYPPLVLDRHQIASLKMALAPMGIDVTRDGTDDTHFSCIFTIPKTVIDAKAVNYREFLN